MANQIQSLLGTLGRLGFNDMEAAIYVDLLKHPGSTGYAIGKSLRKPHANVYQALTTLEQKGAVLFEDGPTRSYCAVPPGELLQQLRASFEAECEDAARAFGRVRAAEPEADRFYRLTTGVQVLERARAIISESRETLLFEGGPHHSGQLREGIAAAMKRGVSVAGMVFREEDLIDGAKMIVSEVADRLLRLGTPAMILVGDARQLLIAHFAEEGNEPSFALWVDSRVLVPLFHNGIVSDVILHGLPVMREIRSPNRHLLGRIPTAVINLLNLPVDGAPK